MNCDRLLEDIIELLFVSLDNESFLHLVSALRLEQALAMHEEYCDLLALS
jgi:hypothetical protein